MLKCRLCNSKEVFLKYKFNNWSVGGCRWCGFWQVLEKPERSKLFETYNGEYFKRGRYLRNRAVELENKKRLIWLKRNGLKRRARILDVGCATGDFIQMAKKDFDMWGLDISEFAVRKARLNNPVISQQIKTGMVEDLNFPNNFFDCIILWDVIEHLWDPFQIISKLVKMLKPKGILAFSTPNSNSLTARLMRKHWHFMTVPEHLSFFNKNTINYLFKMTGLTPLSWMSRGKWVNFGFLVYKIQKTFPKLFPVSFVHWVQQKPKVANFPLYIPVGDIQYVAATR